MSTNRKQIETGWGPPRTNPDGTVVCRKCGKVVPKGRRTFCSAACVHEWRIKTDPGYVRHQVFLRDKGICAKCGTDTMVGTYPRALRTGHLWQADHIIPVIEGGGECDLGNFRTLCTVCHKGETSALVKRLAVKRKSNHGQTGMFG